MGWHRGIAAEASLLDVLFKASRGVLVASRGILWLAYTETQRQKDTERERQIRRKSRDVKGTKTERQIDRETKRQ